MNGEPNQPEQEAAQRSEAARPGPNDPNEAAAVSDGGADAAKKDVPAQPVEPQDPWAHRRGEPRVFAFFWTLYLLASVVGSVMWLAGTASLQPDAYGPAARIMLVAIAAGVTILWPMTRLCQEPPERPLRACLADAIVVIGPVQMVVWPLAFLAGWPLDVIAATAALLAAWGLLTSALLANALLDHGAATASGLTRAGWMIGIVGVVFLGQLLAALGIATGRPWLSELSGLSPFAGVYEVSGHGLTGAERPVTGWQWRLIAGVGAGAVVVWMVAMLRAARSPGPPVHAGAS